MASAGSILSNNTSRQHLSLARRLLFPTHSTDLPPLLVAADVPPELHAELYDLLALALRAYISPWWTKITRYDKEFLPQTASVLTSVVRSLEARALALDLPALVFRDAPAILAQHYRDYRNAASKLSSSYATGGAASLPQLFHHLQPHIALSADGKIDLEYYRQIVDHMLKACLPPEDYAPEAERVIIREVIVKVLVEDVIPKVTQPWFIQKAILDLLGDSEEGYLFKSSDPATQSPSSSFSFHTFIVVVLSALQSFSTTCLTLINAYKQTISTIKRVNQSPAPTPRSASPQLETRPLATHHELERSTSTQSRRIRIPSQAPSISSSPSSASSISYPSRSVFPHSRDTPVPFVQPEPLAPQQTKSRTAPVVHPQTEDYALQPLTLISEVFLTFERLAATTVMTLFTMISASMTPFLDKLLPHLLYSILSPGFILNLVRLSKRTLFPNGYPGPPPVDPTPEEQAALRRRLAEWRGSGALAHLMPFLLGTNPTQTMNAAIDPLTSQPCNVHLTIILLDRILVGLFPELATGDAPTTPTNTNMTLRDGTALDTYVSPDTGNRTANANLNGATGEGVLGTTSSLTGSEGGRLTPAPGNTAVAVGT